MDDFSHFSLADLFKTESETQCRHLSDGLLALEKQPGDAMLLESLMRAAHSLKGAARIVDLEQAVQVAHAMEDIFVAAQTNGICLDSRLIDHLLGGVDLLGRLATAGAPAALAEETNAFVAGSVAPVRPAPVMVSATPAGLDDVAEQPLIPLESDEELAAEVAPMLRADDETRTLRVTAESLDVLLGSSGESLVASRRFRGFGQNLWDLHRHQRKTAASLEAAITALSSGADVRPPLRELQLMIEAGDRQVLTDLAEFERFERNASQLSQRLYEQALACRMMPFGTIAASLRRVVRDTARRLGRDLDLEIHGEGTEVTEISGRGVGLDLVQAAVKAARGTVRIASEPGVGTSFVLQLPISLSVMKALVFEVSGEPYALPLAKIERVLSVSAAEIESIEGAQYVVVGSRRVGIVDAASVLGLPMAKEARERVHLLVLAAGSESFGVAVSRFLGEGEIVVQPLDKRLGRVRDIAAAALTEDGAPMLLIDVEDFLISLQRLAAGGALHGVAAKSIAMGKAARQILVVDDSLTVRELERKLLTALGYVVEVAVDGMDGWNAVRSGRFAAVVTDVDMPRMDGIELTRLIKNDARLRDTPVIIVSYKDREEDRLRGLDAGADYYLTKGSFQDEGLANAIANVLGEEVAP
jgi:chemotaxis protein histidine kinase CheA/ActR/RegA family two-component response regulator